MLFTNVLKQHGRITAFSVM